jgi:hypothetical protein
LQQGRKRRTERGEREREKQRDKGYPSVREGKKSTEKRRKTRTRTVGEEAGDIVPVEDVVKLCRGNRVQGLGEEEERGELAVVVAAGHQAPRAIQHRRHPVTALKIAIFIAEVARDVSRGDLAFVALLVLLQGASPAQAMGQRDASRPLVTVQEAFPPPTPPISHRGLRSRSPNL